MKNRRKYIVVLDHDRKLFDVLDVRFSREIEQRILKSREKGRDIRCYTSAETFLPKVIEKTQQSFKDYRYMPTLNF